MSTNTQLDGHTPCEGRFGFTYVKVGGHIKVFNHVSDYLWDGGGAFWPEFASETPRHEEDMEVDIELPNAFVPVCTGGTLNRDDANKDKVMIICEACTKKGDNIGVVQCYGGHNVCTTCTEGSAKTAISEKRGLVMCPRPTCQSTVPWNELSKALNPLVIDILKDFCEKQNTEAIDKMDDIVKCPSCGFSAALDLSEKVFPCIQCRKAYCRYCKSKWSKRGSHDLCTQTKKWTSTVTGNVVNIPAHWTDDYNTEGHLFKNVARSSQEFLDVKKSIVNYMDLTITDMYRIQNERLWEKYSLTKCKIIGDLGEQNIRERRLFHGTSTDVIKTICEEGFDLRVCGKNGTSYGQGIYFATNPQLSHKYSSAGKILANWTFPLFHLGALSTTTPNLRFEFGAPTTLLSAPMYCLGNPSRSSGSVSDQPDFSNTGDYFMILARVLLGQSCLGRADMRNSFSC